MEKRTKRNLITYFIIGGSCLAIGGTLGVVGKRVLGQEIIDNSNVNPSEFVPDVASIYAKYKKYNGSNVAKDFTPVELVNIALEKYRNCDYCYSVGVGQAKANSLGINVVQLVRSCQIKHLDSYFEESASYSSMVPVAVRSYQEGKDGSVECYKTKSVSSNAESATYSGNPTVYEHDNYKSTWGKTLDEMFIYVISNNTLVSAEPVEIDKESGNLTITLTLDNDFSTYFYQKQMVTISGLDSNPSFSKEKLTFTLTSRLELVHLRCEEEYVATMGFSANTSATIDYYYYPDMYMDIPELNTPFDYSIINK